MQALSSEFEIGEFKPIESSILKRIWSSPINGDSIRILNHINRRATPLELILWFRSGELIQVIGTRGSPPTGEINAPADWDKFEYYSMNWKN